MADILGIAILGVNAFASAEAQTYGPMVSASLVDSTCGAPRKAPKVKHIKGEQAAGKSQDRV